MLMKYKDLGRLLGKEEQKKIKGALQEGHAHFQHTGWRLDPGYGCLCDYHVTGSGGTQWDVCEVQCASSCCQSGADCSYDGPAS